jgi:uncharacterized protein YjbI with pentapeptide repeats
VDATSAIFSKANMIAAVAREAKFVAANFFGADLSFAELT